MEDTFTNVKEFLFQNGIRQWSTPTYPGQMLKSQLATNQEQITELFQKVVVPLLIKEAIMTGKLTKALTIGTDC